MDRVHIIDRLERNSVVFHAMLEGCNAEEIRWKPLPEKWCLLEIICHLYDEEREDFRARLKHVLETPEASMPKIDPPAWVTERRYMEQDLAAMLGKFTAERERSVAWLHGLKDPKWTNAYMHPTVGPVSCDLLLANWLAHDLHHIRQINNLRHDHLAATSGQPLDYAGKW